MAATANYLAFDLGASSGRAMLGTFDGARLHLEELHRFENGPINIRGRLYWNALHLLAELKIGLARCTQRGIQLDGIGIDTWGVDFGLFLATGELLDMPRHYRDPRNRAAMQLALARVPRAEIYERTGIQFLPFNTLFQLYAVALNTPRLLEAADHLLFMPDLFTFWLAGEMATEGTIASTSQMVDARTGNWSRELLEKLGLPARLLPRVDTTGSIAGVLLPEVSNEVGQTGTPVIRTAGHDTAAAVAAVPASGENWAYISSGTWSLIGVELPTPLISSQTLAADFTNEAGVAGTTRFLRNVAGLWLVQECQRTWAAQGHQYSHAELSRLAAAAPALRSCVDPDDPRFAEPGDMPSRICRVCEETGQPVPQSPGEIVRCALESLALKYRVVLDTLERLIRRQIEVLHIVGGGVQNDLLNQFTADATGKLVIAGPVEATAAGNVLVQALAQGRVGSLGELRQVVHASTGLKRYEPHEPAAWQEAFGRFARLGPL
jgi:rhamnulokinase